MRGVSYRNAGLALRRPVLRTPAVAEQSLAWVAARVPLPAIFSAAALVTAHYAVRISSWVVMTDELQYVRLGISAGDHLSPVPQIHGHYFPSLGQVYPLLMAPFLHFLSMPEAWRAVHALNAVLMASTAIPAYILARDVVRSRWAAWFVAAASVVVPWMALSTTLLTEVAGYPMFAWSALAIHRALAKPSARRDVLAVAALALAFYTRPQFVVLVAVLPVCVIAVELRYARSLRDLAAALAGRRVLLVAYGVGALFLAYKSTVGDPSNLLGTYASVTRGSLFPQGLWILFRAQFDYVIVAIGVLPALLAGAWAVPSLIRPRDRAAHVFAVLLVTTVVAVTYEAALFNEKFTPGAAIQDRYNFFVVPLIFVGMAAFLVELRRRTVALLASGAVLVWLIAGTEYRPTSVPYFASPDTIWHRVLTGRAWQLFYDIGIHDVAPSRAIMVATALFTLLGVFAFARMPRAPVAIVACVGVIGYCTVETVYVLKNVAPAGAVSSVQANDTIDQTVGGNARVGAVETGMTGTDAARIWWNIELWNKSVRYTYSVNGSDLFTPFPRNNLWLDFPTGRLKADVGASYLLFDRRDVRFRPVGRHVPVSDAEFDLWKPVRPYRAAWATSGLTNAGWATAHEPVTLRLYRDTSLPERRLVTFRLSTPSPVSARREFTVAAGTTTNFGELRPDGPARTVSVAVCSRGEPFTDVSLSIDGATTGNDPTSASWLGALVDRIRVRRVAGAC